MENYYLDFSNVPSFPTTKDEISHDVSEHCSATEKPSTLNLETQSRYLRDQCLSLQTKNTSRIACKFSSVFQKIKSENWCINGYK